MELGGQSKLLRIFLGENDKLGHRSLYEAIVFAARDQGIAGATVLRGILSFGASTRIHTAKFIDISEDLPIVVEIVDAEEKINEFIPVINKLFDECGRGGLITIEQVNVLYYKPKNK
jgi:PII-like signaling protein